MSLSIRGRRRMRRWMVLAERWAVLLGISLFCAGCYALLADLFRWLWSVQ
jgi:hypothetical protein